MKLSLPTTWDRGFIEKLGKLKNVAEVYGTPGGSIIGGGFPDVELPVIDAEKVRQHIEFVHSRGLNFNYLLNSSCFGGRELDPEFRKKFFEYLDWVDTLGADIVTIRQPTLASIVRREYPGWKIKFEFYERANLVNNIRYFSDVYGARYERISIPANLVRSFDMLKKIQRNISSSLEITVNELCPMDCPLRFYRTTLASHLSQLPPAKIPPETRYPALRSKMALLDPVEILKSAWIRPEDCGVYEKNGIEYFRILGAGRPADWILRCATAYSEENYKGNLLDILTTPCLAVDEKLPFQVDNGSLDGFIEYFIRGKCSRECRNCSYCYEIAGKAVRAELSVKETESLREELKAALAKTLSRNFE